MAEYLTEEKKATYLTLLNTASNAELEDMAEGAAEHYGEIYAQYRSEIALVGDAWPGSAIEVDNLRWYADAADRVWKERFGEVA